MKQIINMLSEEGIRQNIQPVPARGTEECRQSCSYYSVFPNWFDGIDLVGRNRKANTSGRSIENPIKSFISSYTGKRANEGC